MSAIAAMKLLWSDVASPPQQHSITHPSLCGPWNLEGYLRGFRDRRHMLIPSLPSMPALARIHPSLCPFVSNLVSAYPYRGLRSILLCIFVLPQGA